MFNSTVCRLTFSISLVCLVLINSYVLCDLEASTEKWTEFGKDIFDEEVWQKLKEEQILEYKPMTKHLDSYVNNIVREENSFNTSFLIGTRKGVNRFSRITKVVLQSDKPAYLTFKQSVPSLSRNDLILSKELQENKGSCSSKGTCTLCLLSNDLLDCGWCGTKCTQQSECPEKDFTNETCPPIVYYFKPEKAPLAGGTIVQIIGANFGESRYGSLSIAGVDCLPENIKQWSFNKIVVKVPPSKVEATGPIKVSLSKKVAFSTPNSNKIFYSFGTSISYPNFEYTNPTFKQVVPAEVHILEGKSVKVHIIGNNFDIVRNNNSVQVELTIFDKSVLYLPGVLNRTHIIFETSIPSAIPRNIIVGFDEYRTGTGLVFHGIGNPVIDSVVTETARCSGETSIIVKGNYFHRIQNITLGMDFNPHPENRTDCRVDTANQMTCFAPKCPFDFMSGEPHSAEVDFHTDNFSIIYLNAQNWQIKYLPDPNFDNLTMDTKVYIDDPVLQLSGSDLYFGSNILVFVGNWTCEILLEKQESNQLLCRIQFRDHIPVEGDSVAVGYTLRENDETNNLGNIVLLSRTPAESVAEFLKKHWYIPLMTAIAILLFAIAIAYWKLRQRKSPRKKHQDGQHAEFQLSEYKHVTGITKEYQKNEVDDIPTLFVSVPLESLKSDSLDLLEKENKFIAKDRLILGDFIGEGHFGHVYKSELWDINKETKEKVAVKTLQTSASSQSELNVFIEEALIMKDLCHPRVLDLIGVSFLDSMSPVIVTPFMAKGDLLTFLRNADKNPRVNDLIDFAIQIAEGMQYLASKKYVHRDLAARNCLLDHENHIKIADFGLTRDVYEKDYYRPEDKGKMPVKWMAPESLENSLFTTKSDVWSFGVTFWEIITRGRTPYSGIPAWHVIDFLKAGERLGKPDHCPALIYELMTLCWSWDSNDRPTFTDILHEIRFRVEKIEKKRNDKLIERKGVYVNVRKSSYFTHRTQIVWDDL